MNFTAVPSPVAPITTNMTPAIIVTMNKPDTQTWRQYRDDDHKRARRPPNLSRDPPNAEIKNPPIIAV